MPLYHISSHLVSLSPLGSPWLANGNSKPWEQRGDPLTARWAYLCPWAVVLSPGEQNPFRGNSIMALNLPLPSTIQTQASSVLWTEKLYITVTHKKSKHQDHIFSSAHYMTYDTLHNTPILPETRGEQVPPDVIFNFLCWGECFLVLAMCVQSVPVPMATPCFHWRCHFSCHPFRIRHLPAEVLKKCLS